MIEYAFILPNGQVRFEFVDPDGYAPVLKQIEMFKKLHGATQAMSADKWFKQQAAGTAA